MIWLTWRQFRIQATTVYVAVAAFAVVLLLTGGRLMDLQRAGVNVFDQLTRTDRGLYNGGLILVAVAPALIGAFWGAPMVARELEAGTHRLVWNQSVTRTRWLATKLGLTALAAAAAMGVLMLAVDRWARPLDGATSETRGALASRLTPVSFAMRGIVPIGYAVFALVLGVAFGLVVRRTVPAMALTLAVFTFVQIAVPLWVRPHLAPPVRETVAISIATLDGIGISGNGAQATRLTVHTGARGDWVLSNQTVDAAGRPVALPSSFTDCLPQPGPAPEPGPGATEKAPASGKAPLAACLTQLSDAGYQQQVTYQPVSRFWQLQWTETALFLAVSGLLTGFCFWWLRRRLV
jgi:hypothetical protein